MRKIYEGTVGSCYCVSQNHLCLQIFDAVSDGDQIMVWMPAKNKLKTGTDGRWLHKWKAANVTEPRMTFPISPLSIDTGGKVRLVTGVSGTSDLVCDLVKESVAQRSMEKFRKYFVVVRVKEVLTIDFVNIRSFLTVTVLLTRCNRNGIVGLVETKRRYPV